MKKNLTIFLFLLSASVFTKASAQTPNQNTWTFTYLKAIKGQKDKLKKYLKTNWFAMDSIAVRQGLINDYELIDNTNNSDSSEWDFIVAVEYFTEKTYQDIAEKFEIIRKNHQIVTVNGLGLNVLGRIVKSETVQKRSDIKFENVCAGKQFEILAPFLGLWDEYIVEKDGSKLLFGRLTISLNSEGCSLAKRFLLYNKKSTYLTSGYFDVNENAWIETFTFRNGDYAKYKWVEDGKDVVMERIAGSVKSDYLNRNRWTNITYSYFDILEERSYDSGKTWAVYSTTRLVRK